jgi:hypothetical protein
VLEFEPPFCPNESCVHHVRGTSDSDWPWEGRGRRRVERAPYWVRQLRCKACGRWFRSSLFGYDYWKKVPGLGPRVYDLLSNGEGIRRAGHILQRGPTTVRWHLRLLAKQGVLIHVEQHGRLAGKVEEELGLDGLRTFAGSQWEPADVNTAVGLKTSYLYDLNAVGLRRSGAMTEKQRQVRAERDARLGVPPAGARVQAVAEQLARLLKVAPRLCLRTDEEPDYARAVAAAPGKIVHTTVSSRLRRDASNPLWRVNVLHALARHISRPLVRETIAHAKTSAALLDRMWLFLACRNNTKGIRERTVEGSRTTPAMLLGLDKKQRRGKALFARRRFPRQVGLPPELETAYLGTFRARPKEVVKPYLHRFVS